MKYMKSPRFRASLLMPLLAALLGGCGSPESNRVGKGKILKDSEGCAYMARQGVNEVVLLTHVKELSEPTCDLKSE